MKTKIFFFAMLANVAASAQTGITVTPISADYANQTVKFSVSWANSSRNTTHNSKVWVFIDYRSVTNNIPSGSWARALISGTPTATTGTPSRETGNDKGFWLQGTSGSSGTYNATVTVKLSGVPAKFNWCAYVSDFPPNVTANNGTYTFKGTPPFTLIAANGTTTQIVSGKTITVSELTITPTTIKDKTECPGVFCIYTGSDLYIDATHLCQQRTSGAQNWEAYIKDSRDEQIYRITQFSDGTWWFAVDLNVAAKRLGVCNGYSFYDALNKPDCPSGWILPSSTNMNTRWNTWNDQYGGTLTCGPFYGKPGTWCGVAGCNSYNNNQYIVSDGIKNNRYRDEGTNTWYWGTCGNSSCASQGANCDPGQGASVRCFRQL